MSYENIGLYISQHIKKITLLWIICFISTSGILFYYTYQLEKNSVMQNQIISLCSINSETAIMLYYKSSSNNKSEEIDITKTTLSQWINNESSNYQKIIKTSQPEIDLLKNLGVSFYENKNPSELLQKYQKFTDQIDLLQRLAKKSIIPITISNILNVIIPCISGILLILLFVSFSISNATKKRIIKKNAVILEDMWNEIHSLNEINTHQPNSTYTLENIKNISELLIEEIHSIKLQVKNTSKFLEDFSTTTTYTAPSTTSSQNQTELQNKLIYIQKLLSRLFNRAERASSLAQSSSDNGFQAGILALNISIEAARAGENGKPFLAVSDKVKDFAEKSSNIGNAILEELKDADLAIRKAYAIGKNIIETSESPSSENINKSNQDSIQTHKLQETLKILENLNNLSEKINILCIDLEEKLMIYFSESDNTGIHRSLEFMKDTIKRNFDRLYRFNYGIDPPNQN
ncbi:MAG: methyl-accepting chemotaxis protein [Brevinemataceae bacterium]